jgi:hypothetical protein
MRRSIIAVPDRRPANPGQRCAQPSRPGCPGWTRRRRRTPVPRRPRNAVIRFPACINREAGTGSAASGQLQVEFHPVVRDLGRDPAAFAALRATVMVRPSWPHSSRCRLSGLSHDSFLARDRVHGGPEVAKQDRGVLIVTGPAPCVREVVAWIGSAALGAWITASGSIRTNIQGPDSGAIAAAGECLGGRCVA